MLLSAVLAAGALGCGEDGDQTGSQDPGSGSGDSDGVDGDGGDGPPPSERLLVRLENIAPWTLLKSDAVIEQVGGGAGPAGPGQAFEIRLTAGKQQALSFAAMLGESNDWFFAPGPEGIALFDGEGNPRSGDVTSEIALWDAGTEVDQEPAVGPDTAPQQDAPDQGALDPDPRVAALSGAITLSDGSTFELPAVEEMIKVVLRHEGEREFVLHIENVSTDETLQTSMGACAIHVSPLAWALHMMPAPLFDEGKPDRGDGLERIAEDGDPSPLAASLEKLTGFATPVSPGVFVVHGGGEPIYSLAEPDRDLGLERIAEDGDPMPLAAALELEPPEGATETGVFDTAVDASAPGPAVPGSAFEFEVDASGDRLSFAAMYGMSNDWIFATPPDGIDLSDLRPGDERDVTDEIAIYDAGTEIDQEIAIGPFTAPQQPAPDTGPADPDNQVRAADYPLPAKAHIRVTITAAE
jgi:hypothetical protein